MSRDEDDQGLTPAELQHAREGEAARVARHHVDVENVEIKLLTGLDRRQCSAGARHKDDHVTLLLEMQLDQPARCFLVSTTRIRLVNRRLTRLSLLAANGSRLRLSICRHRAPYGAW